MSENKSTALQQRRAAVLEAANKIDEVASLAMSHFTNAGSMAAELQVAQAMADLRSMLTPEVMTPIMALMDTDLGFRTDRDPNQVNYNTGKPNVPYPVEVVKDVVIEAKLRGFHTIGNEFNIIANRFYAAKAGFRRKLTDGKSFPGLTGFRDSYEVPRLVGDKGAIVKCRAEWTLHGKQDSVDCEFAIKVNAKMGADAIIGKAERKLCKRVHDLISGIHTPDAELGEDDLANAVDVTPKEQAAAGPTFKEKRTKKTEVPAEPATSTQQSQAEDQIPGAEVKPRDHIPQNETNPGNLGTANEANREPSNSTGGGGDPAPAASETAKDPESPPADEASPIELKPEQQLVAELIIQAGKADWDTFKRGLSKQKLLKYSDDWEGFHDLPVETCNKIMGAKKWALGVLDTGRQ